MQPNTEALQQIIIAALTEDVGHSDITSEFCIDEAHESTYHFITREDCVVCGAEIAAQVLQVIDMRVEISVVVADGTQAKAGQVLATVKGPTRSLLTGERVALNLLQRMCGIATEVAKYVEAVAGTKADILDTRKTMPCLRVLDKYAVRVGGGVNHRMRLDDAILIKDNHIAAAGGIAPALTRAKENRSATMVLEVECDTLAQVREVLEIGADRILLDNMNVEQLKEAVALIGNQAITEASGGVTLATVAAIAASGVDAISIGALTHSVRNIDIGLDA